MSKSKTGDLLRKERLTVPGFTENPLNRLARNCTKVQTTEGQKRIEWTVQLVNGGGWKIEAGKDKGCWILA